MSSRSYYFESATPLFENVEWNKLISVLKEMGMVYFKYLQYPLQLCVKLDNFMKNKDYTPHVDQLSGGRKICEYALDRVTRRRCIKGV
jgi:hypothetical protein